MVRILVIYDNHNFSSPIGYTLGMIFSIYGVNYCIMPFKQFKSDDNNLERTLVISYGREYLYTGARKQIHVYASDFFGKDFLKANSVPKTPLSKYHDLPIIYLGNGDFNGWVKKSENLIQTNIDIIAATFFMLSRYEEVVIDAKDQYGRFPATASLAYKDGFLDRPIVNEYMELLWKWVHSLEPRLVRKPLWPDKKDFVFCLTHDVDRVKKYPLLPPLKSIGSALLRDGNVGLGFNIASDYIRTLFHFQKDPFDTFNYMLNLEENYRFKSSFFFLAGKESKFHNSYSVTHPGVVSLINKLEARGCEVGLHAGYNSYDNLNMIVSEKKDLDKVVSQKSYGCRLHVLRWKTPSSWQIQEKAGLLYDTTLSFAGHAGFRCGICLPFQPFDIMENRKLRIWELPLTVMDRSLQNPNYQNLSPDAAYKEIIKYIETVRRFKGVFVLLWHNSSFDPLGGWKNWRAVYERIMEYSSKQNAFVANGREVIKWWRQNLDLI